MVDGTGAPWFLADVCVNGDRIAAIAARETATDLMQTHLSAASNKLNEVMKVLTMISTTVLPMTLISGIYGMNFDEGVWPASTKDVWGFLGSVGLMSVSALASLVFFRWKGWI